MCFRAGVHKPPSATLADAGRNGRSLEAGAPFVVQIPEELVSYYLSRTGFTCQDKSVCVCPALR